MALFSLRRAQATSQSLSFTYAHPRTLNIDGSEISGSIHINCHTELFSHITSHFHVCLDNYLQQTVFCYMLNLVVENSSRSIRFN